MSRFAVDHLSPLAARRRLDEVDLEEKSRLAEGLALIALMDERRDYLEAGHSCMQRYCMDHLRMSEEQALRRIRVARLGRQFPTVFDRIADGRLTMSNACELAPVLTTANAEALLDAATHQTKLTVRRLAIEAVRGKAVPVLDVAAAAVDSANCSEAPSPSLEELCGLGSLGSLGSHDTSLTSPAPARVNSQVRGRIVPTADGARERPPPQGRHPGSRAMAGPAPGPVRRPSRR